MLGTHFFRQPFSQGINEIWKCYGHQRKSEQTVGQTRRGRPRVKLRRPTKVPGLMVVPAAAAAATAAATEVALEALAGLADLAGTALEQGLALVHFPAQYKRFLWDRVAFELFRGCVGGNRECQGPFRVYFVSEAAQVELKGGRV